MKIRPTSLRQAKIMLARLRHVSSDFMYYYNMLKGSAARGDFTLSEIGTSAKELEQLRSKGYQRNAMIHLQALRGEFYSAFTFIKVLKRLRETVRVGKFSLEDIGTSEDELAAIKKAGYKRIALNWLDGIRHHCGGVGSQFGYMYDALRNGGLTLEDIGSSQAEIDGFLANA